MSNQLNVADRLAAIAREIPAAKAVASANHGRNGYATITFCELDQAATEIARGLVAKGVRPGMRLVLLVPAGIDFVTLVFALLKSGATTVLVDPGLGRKHLLKCLEDVEPEGFVAIPKAQAIRALLSGRFPRAKVNVTIGRRWFWRGPNLPSVRSAGIASNCELPTTRADDPAAIIFTSGSTGPPKGVLYTHQMFDTQVEEIKSKYDIRPGAIDLACFPLFALFNSAMGVTTVLPDMDFSRPATADPNRLLAAATDWQVTQSFASPAVWNRLSDHCLRHEQRIESLKRVFSCGAPVPAQLLRRTLASVHPKAEMHTPYGATECLPVATIEAAQVLGETAELTDEGAGICVGKRFDAADWKIIRITDNPIEALEDAEELSRGEIGELIVRGPQASPEYVTCVEANATSKIQDGNAFWHRMGDVGYLDDEERFWYCGRKSQRVVTKDETLFTIPVEAVFNAHPKVKRSALVASGTNGKCEPVIVFEPLSQEHVADVAVELLDVASRHPHTRRIDTFFPHPALPVDVRHNSKINREKLAQLVTAASLRQTESAI